MPRNGSGVYSADWVNASPNTTIESAKQNAMVADLVADANAARPVTAGGTGETTARLKDGTWRFQNTADTSKLLAFDLSGLPTATTTTVTIPAKGGTLATTGGPDLRRQRIVNGDMKDSQENGTTSGTTNGYYAADQFATYRVTSAGTITSQRVAAVSPAGSPYRYRVTITAADASLAADEYLTISQNLEGSNVADFQYGGASAKASVLRFGFKGPAGTYAARVGNSAANRSFVALFTITAGQANTDTVQTIAITGDTTGTWLTADGVIGMTLEIVLACGSTYQGVAGWQAGLILGTSGVSNGMATGSAVFELFDVGLKLDPDATGVYGQYEVGEVHPVYRSERYLPVIVGTGAVNESLAAGYGTASTEAYFFPVFQVRPCKPPTGAAVSSTGHFTGFTTGSVTLTGVSFVSASFQQAWMLMTAESGFTALGGCQIRAASASAKITFTGCRLS